MPKKFSPPFPLHSFQRLRCLHAVAELSWDTARGKIAQDDDDESWDTEAGHWFGLDLVDDKHKHTSRLLRIALDEDLEDTEIDRVAVRCLGEGPGALPIDYIAKVLLLPQITAAHLLKVTP